MKLSPTVVNSGSTINVNFSDGNDKGSDLVVVSTFGAAVLSYHVPAGQSSTQIQANISGRNRQTLWGGCTDANPKLLLNDT